MNKPKIPFLLFGTISVYILVCTVLLFVPEKDSPVSLESPKAAFSKEGNFQSRLEYESQMLINPRTGEIPSNIRKKELIFAHDILEKELDSRFKRLKSENGQDQASEQLTWTPIGPQNVGGRTRALALDVTDEDIILAGGVSGGVWRSENGGQAWTKTTSPDQIQSVTAITQDVRAGKENNWYYGTGELVGNSGRAPGAPFRGDGIFKSTDGGQTWQSLASTRSETPGSFVSPFQYVWDITTDPNAANDVILAAVWGGIVRSTDGGLTWQTVLGGDYLNMEEGTDLNEVLAVFYTDIHRTSNGVFYASLSSVTNDSGSLSPLGGVYQSIDGINWTRILDLSQTPTQRIEIGSSSTKPEHVYFLADRTIIGYGLWRYNDNTNTVTSLSQNLPDGADEEIEELDSQESYNLVVAVHPNNENVVYVGGTNLYRSTDGFATKTNITWIGGYAPEDEDVEVYPNHHPDQHGILFYPSNPNKMISANDGGLFLTNDNLADEVVYSSLNNGYITTQFYTASYSRDPETDLVFGGTQDNGTLLTRNQALNSSANGFKVLGGDGAFTASTPFGVYYYFSFQNSQIYRVTLNDQFRLSSFARVDPIGGGSDPSQSYLFINPYVLDPSNSNRMYLAGGDHIWFNQNLSQIPAGSQSPTSVNWKKLERTEISDGTISALQISVEPRNILFYGTTDGKLYKVEDAHSELYSVTDITSSEFPENGYLKSIAIDPTDADHILVCFSNYGVRSIFSSIDGGETFTSVSGNLEEEEDGSGNGPSVRWVSIVPKTTGGHEYYAATSVGLFAATSLNNDLTTWNLESSDEIGNAIIDMVDYRQSDGKIVAATHGNGLYTSQIQNVTRNPNLGEVEQFSVEAVYPNPFSDEVRIRVIVPSTQFIFIRVYNDRGQEVKRISSSLAFEGENDFFWNGTNGAEQPVASGIYLIRISHQGGEETRRVVLQRD